MSNRDLIFECLLCPAKYSLRDAEKGRYFIETRVCLKCYRKGQVADRKVWCFGKKQKKNRKGYSVKNIVCSAICPDRNICKQFVKLKRRK